MGKRMAEFAGCAHEGMGVKASWETDESKGRMTLRDGGVVQRRDGAVPRGQRFI